jgi:hypothetical protein
LNSKHRGTVLDGQLMVVSIVLGGQNRTTEHSPMQHPSGNLSLEAMAVMTLKSLQHCNVHDLVSNKLSQLEAPLFAHENLAKLNQI